MEIDLENLVFNGLDEAEERNAERLDDADKKAQAIVADLMKKHRLTRCFFLCYFFSPSMAACAQASSR